MCRLIYQLRAGHTEQRVQRAGMCAAAGFFERFCAKQDIFCGAAQSLCGLLQAKKEGRRVGGHNDLVYKLCQFLAASFSA